jgi:hypothetical protein
LSRASDADIIGSLSNRNEAPAAGGAQDQTAAAEPGDTGVAVGVGDPSPDDLARPASEADVRRVYLDATSMGYIINGVGPITAFTIPEPMSVAIWLLVGLVGVGCVRFFTRRQNAA